MNRTDAWREKPGYQTRIARVMGTMFTAVWLLYLIGPVVDLFTGHYSALYRWGGLAIIIVFCAVYVMVVPNWPLYPRYGSASLVVMAVLAAVACVIYGGSGAVALWIFLSSASGLLVVNRRWAVRAVLGCVVCYVIFSYTGHVGGEDFWSNLLPVVFVGLAMIGMRRQFQLTAELSRAREEVVQLAASEERLRLARDMHDRPVAVHDHPQVGAGRPAARPPAGKRRPGPRAR
jgi:two-component system, NarL family, sensor histidine kinase DesK